VTGRIKDLIIIRGRNIYPQDVEASVARAHPLLYTHRSAAFSILDAEDEQLVVVHEIARQPAASDEAAAALQDAFRAVIDQFDTAPHDIVLVQPAAIPTTSSGKVQRAKARAAYLERSFRVLARFRTDSAPS
jgi:acyl-CoA synthetase (AMP-forming)/AMP-acid ligase II